MHSISWGSPEQNYDSTWEQRLDTEFLRLATMGLTVLTASGDDGPNNDGLIGCKNFHPTFPASSPHVTAVGGTYFPKRSPSSAGAAAAAAAAAGTADPEVCWDSSGGGFSGVFPRPKYQDAAITPYLTTSGLPAASRWNSSGPSIQTRTTQLIVFHMVYHCRHHHHHYLSGRSFCSCVTVWPSRVCCC